MIIWTSKTVENEINYLLLGAGEKNYYIQVNKSLKI